MVCQKIQYTKENNIDNISFIKDIWYHGISLKIGLLSLKTYRYGIMSLELGVTL